VQATFFFADGAGGVKWLALRRAIARPKMFDSFHWSFHREETSQPLENASHGFTKS
jgi:hypothetical protein